MLTALYDTVRYDGSSTKFAFARALV